MGGGGTEGRGGGMHTDNVTGPSAKTFSWLKITARATAAPAPTGRCCSRSS